MILARVPRAFSALLLGACAGAALAVFAYVLQPAIDLTMDADPPPSIRGLHPVERAGDDETFAWTMDRVDINLPGLSRALPWTATLRVRGGRPNPTDLPEVVLTADGVIIAQVNTSNDYADIKATIPPRGDADGVRLRLTTSTTFTPGPEDPRRLGVVLDRITIAPTGRTVVIPPVRTIRAGAVSAAVMGASFGLIGVTAGSAVGGAVLLALAQGFVITRGLAPFTPFVGAFPWLAFWIALAAAAAVWIVEAVRGEPLRNTARFAVVFSAATLFLKLLALFHPAARVGDAVFHAHRLDWVLAGRYFFTQPLPDGVQFPYAIALYVFAAPWSAFTRNHVLLLRVVVCAAEVIAGALLYPAIARTRGDRLAAAVAVALFGLVPLSYVIAGNANLTNAFGQSAALATVAAATIWSLGHLWQVAALSALAALAFLSHVSTFPLLLATLLGLIVLYAWSGVERRAARSIVIAAAIAAVFSVVTYYGRFAEVYERLGRVVSATAAPAPQSTGADQTPSAADTPAPQPARTLGARLVAAGRLTVRAAGVPILMLALAGVWREWRHRTRDRLRLALLAWGATYAVFVGFTILAPVDTPYQRYTDEFIDRVNYAAMPAIVILAAQGAVWAWRAGTVLRLAGAALLLAATVVGVQQWFRLFV